MRKRIITAAAVQLLIIWGTSITVVAKQAKYTGLEQEIVLSPPPLSDSRAGCSFQKHDDTAISYYSGWDTGDRFVTYFDIADECGASPYPFEIQSISFTLYDPSTFQWPVNMDIVVFGLAGTDSCDGPGDELCRIPVVCDEATFGLPNISTVYFPTHCCISGPVFIGMEYTDTGAGQFPSILFDKSAPVPACDNWAFGPVYWSEWYDFWSPPEPGYPIFFVDGNTQSVTCDSSIVINEVRPYPFSGIQNSDKYNYAFVELYNSGGYVLDLDSWGLTNIDGSVLAALPPLLLEPGNFLKVYFGVGTEDLDFSDGVGSYYTGGDSSIFDSAFDGVAIYIVPANSTTIVDATFWSTDGSIPSGTAMSDAVTAGIWSSGDYFEIDPDQPFVTYGICPDGIDHNTRNDWRIFGWGDYGLTWAAPQNPIQLSPPNGALLDDYSDVLTWADLSFADSFQVEVDNNPSFLTPERTARTTGNSYTVAGLSSGVYYWRVKVYDGGSLLLPYATYEMIVDPTARGGASRVSVQLGVNRLIQHKDTRLLCDYESPAGQRPGCDEAAGKNGPWDNEHGTDSAHVAKCEHCSWYCSRAVIAMINNYFNGNLKQDRVSYELFFGTNAGPEADLGHNQGTWLGTSGGAHGTGRRWQIYEWALGAAVARSAGKPSFATIQSQIDAGHPIYIDGQNHATLVYGYYFENLQGTPTPAVYIHNPWPGTAGFSSYAAWQPDNAGWANAGYFTIPVGYDTSSAIDQEASVTADTDGDEIRDFDESLVRNFQSLHNDTDTDDDEVRDKAEIRNYTFHDTTDYHPGHVNDALTFPDVDGDNLRAENDCDCDDDGDFDGGEDINGNGKNPVPNAGNVCDRETCQFDAAESCIKVAVDKDTYFLGEPVYIVDYHYTRETHTYHSSSTYNYEKGNDCPVKTDGSALGHNGSFTTNAGGHADKTMVEHCLSPGQRYLTVDVLDDNLYSAPDNLDPQTCWTCLNDWFHGFHWAYDYGVHNPFFPYPNWNFPATCVFEGGDPSVVNYVIECPWWWWCYSWPPIFDSYWLAIQLDRYLISDGIIEMNRPPSFIQGIANCGGSVINTFNFDPILTQQLEGTSTDTSKQWLAFSIPNWQIPDSLISTRIELDVKVGTKFDAYPLVKVMAGDAVYGWSPTPYDSIPISIISVCCVNPRGDLNGDGMNANIIDLNFLVNRIFRGGPAASCPEEADVNSDGTPSNIVDLNFLVNRIFRGGAAPGPC